MGNEGRSHWKLEITRAEKQGRHSLMFIWQLQGAELFLSIGCKSKIFNMWPHCSFNRDCPKEWVGSRVHMFIQLFGCKSPGKNTNFCWYEYKIWTVSLRLPSCFTWRAGNSCWAPLVTTTLVWIYLGSTDVENSHPLLATCSDRTSLSLVFIFKCSLLKLFYLLFRWASQETDANLQKILLQQHKFEPMADSAESYVGSIRDTSVFAT